ncbi:TetR/AcrR family tetracycline transcriptional repressor [Paenibacillus taihuensis]|uniref:TetR/AcrR family tetracycline transcriptional repressor n=1 Tax=Paenibacillus taihuensis TaxID=1156355 RepID=A0A3D9RHV7_9BACL|nr:TetR/AcrR family tetracycline transcriptional repressor [Paenibacillus taihuensis]
MDAMSEAEAGLFRKMLGGGLFELMGSDGSFEFGLNLILLGIEQVIKEQE